MVEQTGGTVRCSEIGASSVPQVPKMELTVIGGGRLPPGNIVKIKKFSDNRTPLNYSG